MHNQEWLRWANERDMQQMEEEDDSFDGIGRHNFQHSRSDDSHGDAMGSDLDHSGQFVGSLGRHETVQMAGFESDDDDDFIEVGKNLTTMQRCTEENVQCRRLVHGKGDLLPRDDDIIYS